jgi:hypothetical protein
MVGSGETGSGRPSHWAWLTAHRQVRVTCETWTWLAVAVGVILRLLGYAEGRRLYMDERSLLENLVNLPVFDFRTTLTEYQLAPPGFLVVERLMVRTGLPIVPAARLLPLACGLAAMVVFRLVARRYVSRWGVPIAVGLFALDDWLIYYSSEIKQYTCDLVLTLVALLLVTGPAPAGTPGPSPLSLRRLLTLAGFGVVGVWFSYSLALVLAGAGTYLMAVSALRREGRRALGLAAIGLVWMLSFAACYAVSHAILSKERFIWDWWDFAFLRLPPRSFAQLTTDFWQVVNVFDSPANVRTPLGVLPSAMLALGLFLCGCAALGTKWPGGLYLLLAPILLAMLASALRQYPFHGRLLIFLVPSIHLLVGEGAAALTGRGRPWLALALGAFLLLQPASEAIWHGFIQGEQHVGFDSHGDLRADLLDYLEHLEAKGQRSRSTP